MAPIYEGGWAGRPVAGLSVGDKAFITDVGLLPSEWRWDGARWRTSAPVLLASIESSGLVFPPISDIALIPGMEILLPVGLFQIGTRVRMRGLFNYGSATELRGVQVPLWDEVGGFGLTWMAATLSTTATNNAVVEREFAVVAADTIRTAANTVAGPGNTAAATLQTTDPLTSSALYLSPVVLTGAVASVTIYYLNFYLEA